MSEDNPGTPKKKKTINTCVMLARPLRYTLNNINCALTHWLDDCAPTSLKTEDISQMMMCLYAGGRGDSEFGS